MILLTSIKKIKISTMQYLRSNRGSNCL